jgi:two-component system capsular synthesis sensor histidine kinase RcsC
MPYLNGYELARKLRAEGVSVPIVGVTANAMRDEEQRCVAAGMNGWLVKPIDLRELVALLRTYTPVGRITERGENNCLARLEPDVLDKHRHLFLQSMWDDWHQLDAGITQRDAETVAMILHRMRSALVLAQQRELASRMERLEQQIQASGMDGDCIADVLAMAKEIYRLIVRIETDSIA